MISDIGRGRYTKAYFGPDATSTSPTPPGDTPFRAQRQEQLPGGEQAHAYSEHRGRLPTPTWRRSSCGTPTRPRPTWTRSDARSCCAETSPDASAELTDEVRFATGLAPSRAS